MNRHQSNRFKSNNRAGFTMVEMIAVLVIIGILAAVSGAFLAPMAQGFVSGRRMLRAANASQFALERLSQLLSMASDDSISVSGNSQVTVKSQISDAAGEDVVVAFDSAAGAILVNGKPLITDVASYEVYYADGIISNRVTFEFAEDWPVNLLIYPRN